jgi:hypothetical protein
VDGSPLVDDSQFPEMEVADDRDIAGVPFKTRVNDLLFWLQVSLSAMGASILDSIQSTQR